MATHNLDDHELDRLWEDFLALTALTVEDWVRARHLDLQRRGLSNQEIFARIRDDLPRMRFAAGSLSERQVRRIIYG